MKITIITVVYNGAATIRESIRSVLGQDYPDTEYIIVDGASTDRTLEIVSEFSDRIATVVSEPDSGIYDAMNKGIALASGEIIGILNADDVYAGPSVLSKAVAVLQDTSLSGCYGDLVYVDSRRGEKIVRKWTAGNYHRNSFLHGWMPPHPTLFLKKTVYDRFGLFRLDMGSAADYELMLRMIYKHKIAVAYIPEILVRMRTGGVSNLSIKNRLKANEMDRLAWKVNKLKVPFYTTWLKPFRKIHQFFVRF